MSRSTTRPSTTGREAENVCDLLQVEREFLHRLRSQWRRILDACCCVDKCEKGHIRFPEFVEVLNRYNACTTHDKLHAMLSAACQDIGTHHSVELAEYSIFICKFGPRDARRPTKTSLALNGPSLREGDRGVRKTFDDLAGVSWNNAWKQSFAPPSRPSFSSSMSNNGATRAFVAGGADDNDRVAGGDEPQMTKLMHGVYYTKPSAEVKRVWRHQAIDETTKMPMMHSLIQGTYYGKDESTERARIAAQMREERKRNDFIARNRYIAKRFSDYVSEQKKLDRLEHKDEQFQSFYRIVGRPSTASPAPALSTRADPGARRQTKSSPTTNIMRKSAAAAATATMMMPLSPSPSPSSLRQRDDRIEEYLSSRGRSRGTDSGVVAAARALLQHSSSSSSLK